MEKTQSRIGSHGLRRLRIEVKATDFLRRQVFPEASSRLDRRRPPLLPIGETERMRKMERIDIRLTVAGKTIGMVRDKTRIEPFVLPGGSPGESSQRSIGFVQMDCIDEVARLAPARESEELLRGGIGEVETPAEFIVGLHRIKAKRRVLTHSIFTALS